MKPRAANVKHVEIVLVGVAFVAGFAANMERRAHVSVQTRTVHVARSWGKPDASIPGEQVNANFKGLTCKIFQARKTVVCEP